MRIKHAIYVVILCLIVAVIGLMPLIDGMLFKRTYLAFLRAQSADNKTKITILDYRLGWFKSHSKIHIEFISPSQMALPLSGITIDQEIVHGPLAYDEMNNRWAFVKAIISNHIETPAFLAALIGNPMNQADLHVSTRADFDGTYTNQVTASPIAVLTPYGKISWGGLRGVTKLYLEDHHVNRLKTNFNIGSIESANTQGSFSLQEMTVRGDIAKQPVGLWTGYYEISLPKIMMTSEGDVTTLQGLNFLFTASTDAESD